MSLRNCFARAYIFLFILLLPLAAEAQTASQPPTTVEAWADRLGRFGRGIPQEKVFVHMDNTCYFLGDTIWYAAYTRRTDSGRPSDVSRVLYVELLSQDGYLVERQLVEMRGGRGHGNFVIPDTLYGGYYELRAYTRWQLNWGVTEKEHTPYAEDWFFNKTLAREFYRDYEKLYSRVFPVYDKPAAPGEYFRDMTLRPLRRYFKSGASEPQLVLSLFPEGGRLVAGVPCRVAFEAATEAGEAVDGDVRDSRSADGVVASTENRGRGAFTITPEAGRDYTFTFTARDGRTAEATLPKAEADGVALSVAVPYSATASQSSQPQPQPSQSQSSQPQPHPSHPQSQPSQPHPSHPQPHYLLSITPVGAAARQPLGLTIQNEGRLVTFRTIQPAAPQPATVAATAAPSPATAAATAAPPLATAAAATLIALPADSLPVGVNQATVFDADGRVWADRLFFVSKPQLQEAALTISGLKDEYAPYEQATLEVVCPTVSPSGFPPSVSSPSLSSPSVSSPSLSSPSLSSPSLSPPSGLSLSVRDAAATDHTYDTSDILSEMLLASELRGYIPDPAYFFRADDEEHRRALDLLMLTQGWRRFDWHTMATPGAFALTQPAETQTQILRGEVLRYSASIQQDDVRSLCDIDDGPLPKPYQLEEQIRNLHPTSEAPDPARTFRTRLTAGTPSIADTYDSFGQGEVIEAIVGETYSKDDNSPAGSYRMKGNIAASRFSAKEKALPREMRVHAEFTQPGSQSVVGDMDTKDGRFTIPAPDFQGYCVFFLAASDTTKWKAGKTHTWIYVESESTKSKAPEFYVRIAQPYPRFTHPYSHYQLNAPPLDPTIGAVAGAAAVGTNPFDTQMQTVTVRARRSGLRRFDASKPAFAVDAYEAYNDACDAGLMCGQFRGRFHFINSLARLYVGDMNTANTYLLEPRYDNRNVSFNFTAAQIERYNYLTNLDSVRIYTDFAPRTGGDPRATEDNVERLTVNLCQMPDEGQRLTYRDRRYILQGFSVADDFYNPDYQRTPPTEATRDYRRTIYWNPDLKLDAEGRATVTFFNGSKSATLNVEANGLAADGTPLTN